MDNPSLESLRAPYQMLKYQRANKEQSKESMANKA